MMMEEMIPTCPKCSSPIQGDDVNASTDIAFCRSCNVAHKLSVIIRSGELMVGLDLNKPPKGVCCNTFGTSTTVVASHRALGAALGSLAVALFWNGITSTFVLLALASTLKNMNVTVPEWFPAPEMNGSMMGVGMTLFLWLFLTPFIVIGMGMLGAFLMALGGKTEVHVDRGGSYVFTGIGFLGYRRRFSAADVLDVRIDDVRWRDSDGDSRRKTHVVIETRTGKVIRLGSMLTEERRKFVAAFLRRTLLK